MKTAYFDMDGTIADFYGVENWLDYLVNYDTYPYRSARPMFTPSEVETLITSLLEQGYRIGIISWCSKGNDKKFKRMVKGIFPIRQRNSYCGLWCTEMVACKARRTARFNSF